MTKHLLLYRLKSLNYISVQSTLVIDSRTVGLYDLFLLFQVRQKSRHRITLQKKSPNMNTINIVDVLKNVTLILFT